MLCGGLIGLERTRADKPGGTRTLMLVSLGATLFMVVSISVSTYFSADLGRIAAQVVTGIGLLGAGVIIAGKGSTSGIAAAASIWISAAIGLAIGAGLFVEGILVTVILYLVLGWLHRYINI